MADTCAYDEYIHLICFPFCRSTVHQGGLVARITHAYLQRRAAIVRSRSLFAARDGEGEDEAGERDGLAEALEYIESPLEQMKRAGLGLLSKGLGRYAGRFACSSSLSQALTMCSLLSCCV